MYDFFYLNSWVKYMNINSEWFPVIPFINLFWTYLAICSECALQFSLTYLKEKRWLMIHEFISLFLKNVCFYSLVLLQQCFFFPKSIKFSYFLPIIYPCPVIFSLEGATGKQGPVSEYPRALSVVTVWRKCEQFLCQRQVCKLIMP